jgi:ribosomal protein S27AE
MSPKENISGTAQFLFLGRNCRQPTILTMTCPSCEREVTTAFWKRNRLVCDKCENEHQENLKFNNTLRIDKLLKEKLELWEVGQFLGGN